MNDIAKAQEHQVAPSETGAVLSMIERVASNPDADMDKLERLLDMQERILDRNAMVAFNAAMAAMQSDIPTIQESGAIVVDGHRRSKYARFEDIMRVVNPILHKHGFAVSFRTKTGEGFVKVTGVLMHREGHREETDMQLPIDTSGKKNIVQAIGSSTAYGRRYVLCALLNIATGDEDDDCQAAGSQPGHEQGASHNGSQQQARDSYPSDSFKKNLPAWKKLVLSGKKTPEAIIKSVQARAALTQDQIDQIKAIGQEQQK